MKQLLSSESLAVLHAKVTKEEAIFPYRSQQGVFSKGQSENTASLAAQPTDIYWAPIMVKHWRGKMKKTASLSSWSRPKLP